MFVYKDQDVVRRLEVQARHRAKLDELHRLSVRISARALPRRPVCRCAICEAARAD